MSVSSHLDPYQVRAVDFACEREGSALFLEQGTGKTYVTCGIVEREMAIGSPISALVVGPLANLETTWVATLSLIGGLTICRTWDEFKTARGVHRLLLLNYERVRPVIRRLKKVQWTVVVYDESQRLKSRGSKQSRDAARLSGVATRRVLLSGTPIEQCPQDLWAQFRFALPDVLETRWADFEAAWMKPSGYMGYKLKFRKEKLPQFLTLIEPHILRVKKEDVLDLPPLRFIRAVVPLVGDHRRIYDEITDGMATTIDGEPVTCDMAITQLVRQQQVTGGICRLDPTREERVAAARARKPPRGRIVYVGRAKLDRTIAIVRREEKPIVIFCRYREELARLVREVQRIGLRVDSVSGRSKRTRAETVRAFQSGRLDVLVVQIRAGGVGLDLQNASVAIFYSVTHSWIDFDQAVSRLHRRGQMRIVRVYLVLAQNTVDEEVRKALRLKRSVTELVLNRRRSKNMAKPDKSKAPQKSAPAKPAPAKSAEKPAEKAAAEKPVEKPAEAPAEKKKPTPPPQPPKPNFGVPELAAALGVKGTSVRVRLRAAGIPKSGKVYGWDTKEEMQAVIDKLQAASKSKAKKEGEGAAEEGDEEDGDDEGEGGDEDGDDEDDGEE